MVSCLYVFFFFFKQKTAYEMRISDWSSDVCSSDLATTCRSTSADPQVGATSPTAIRSRRPMLSDARCSSVGRSKKGRAEARPFRHAPHGNQCLASSASTFCTAASASIRAKKRARRSEERRVGKEGVRQGK